MTWPRVRISSDYRKVVCSSVGRARKNTLTACSLLKLFWGIKFNWTDDEASNFVAGGSNPSCPANKISGERLGLLPIKNEVGVRFPSNGPAGSGVKVARENTLVAYSLMIYRTLV